MNIAFTGPQRSEYYKKFYPIDHIACDKISRNSAKPPHEVLVIVEKNGKNWLDRFHTEYKSCAIITTRASVSIRPIHHRMPVILKPEAYAAWLDPRNQDNSNLNQILKTSILTEFVTDLSPSPQKTRHQQLSLID
jgi:hypothetical protein